MQEEIAGNTLQVQSVIYENEKSHLLRSAESIFQAASYALDHRTFSRIALAYGDCSVQPVLAPEDIDVMNAKFSGKMTVSYAFWGANLGTAKGHNTLARNCESNYIIVENPDILMCYDTISMLFEPFRVSPATTGMSEAKQIPIEHPKYYDPNTGETSWSSTACTMFPKHVFDLAGGFDSDSFFLYCDDVDFSWKVRLKGFKVIYQPCAAVFHNKTLSNEAKWQSTSAERYYSAEAGLLLAYKWSRKDLSDKILAFFKKSSEPYYVKAACEFERRRMEGRLPKQLDRHHKVAEFVDGNYGKMRFSL